MKGRVDSFFGQLERRRRLTAMSRPLRTVEEVVECYREHYTQVRQRNPGGPTEEHIVWLPACGRAEVLTCSFTKASWPCGLRHSHTWTIFLKDRRRAANTARETREVDNISLRAHVLPTLNLGMVGATTPWLKCPEDDAVDEPPEDLAEDPLAAGALEDEAAGELAVGEPEAIADDCACHADLPEHCKTWRGWRLAYRTQMPEQHDVVQRTSALRRKYNSIGAGVIDALPVTSRSASAVTLEAQAKKAVSVASARGKRETKFAQGLRART